VEEINSKKFKEAAEKFQRLGPLAVTAADHQAIGSTPPPELRDNPGKTLEELYSDAEIDNWLAETREAIADFLTIGEANDFVKSALKNMRADLDATERYLKHIGRR
jgi:hypothetical protein